VFIVTGGAGFIGSAVIWGLNQRGKRNIIVSDEISNLDKFKKDNLKYLKYMDIMDKKELLKYMQNRNPGKVQAVFHMGACSSTVETDEKYLMNTNLKYTKDIMSVSLKLGARFIYASSAATYGDGGNGFCDDHEKLEDYKPLNLYGQSKHLFDLWAKKEGFLDRIAGLKYFNVYGPNEYHKKDMRSFVIKAYEQIKNTGEVKLFKSYRKDYKHGEQKRDFIYIKDAVKMTLYFLDNLKLNGIYNIGTGEARTWNKLVEAVFNALKKEPKIKYIEMPESVKNQYQYYTKAEMKKLFSSGYNSKIYDLSEGVHDYVCNYLIKEKRLGE